MHHVNLPLRQLRRQQRERIKTQVMLFQALVTTVEYRIQQESTYNCLWLVGACAELLWGLAGDGYAQAVVESFQVGYSLEQLCPFLL